MKKIWPHDQSLILHLFWKFSTQFKCTILKIPKQYKTLGSLNLYTISNVKNVNTDKFRWVQQTEILLYFGDTIEQLSIKSV